MGMDEEAAYQAAMKDAKHNILNSTQILSMLKFSNVSLRLFDRVAVAPRRKRVVSLALALQFEVPSVTNSTHWLLRNDEPGILDQLDIVSFANR